MMRSSSVLKNMLRMSTKRYLTTDGGYSKADFNMKNTNIEDKIPVIVNLSTKPAINTKATEIENKLSGATRFITTPEFNRLRKLSFNAIRKKTL